MITDQGGGGLTDINNDGKLLPYCLQDKLSGMVR